MVKLFRNRLMTNRGLVLDFKTQTARLTRIVDADSSIDSAIAFDAALRLINAPHSPWELHATLSGVLVAA